MDPGSPGRVAVVGVSIQPIDGVRDHALVLSEALRAENVCCSHHWLLMGAPGRARRASLLAWTRGLSTEVHESGAQALLFHYSAFSYYDRGLPLLVHPMVTALRGCQLPLITIMHEFVYPWRSGGVKGIVWALADRAALRELVAASSAVIATTESRLGWLRSRWWLPAPAAALAPTFSNLPAPTVSPPADRAVPVVGLFGYYAVDAGTISLVLDALCRLLRRGVEWRLMLLGSPERSPAVGEIWSRAAGAHGLTHMLSITGTLPAQELSNALARCDLLLYANLIGPISSKGTLAASLASGRPVIALEGQHRWQELLDADAARVVPRRADALADAVEELLRDAYARSALGARGRSFAQATIGVARTAAAVIGLLEPMLRAAPEDQ
jgi:hypothetical protein